MNEDRRSQIRQIREIHGLSTAEAGRLLGVTAKAWQHWESGIRNMPDTKYELLLTKVSLEVNNVESGYDIVTICNIDSSRLQTAVGCVSNLNYLGHNYSADRKIMCVDSLILDLVTMRRRRNRICFKLQDNLHVEKAVKKWEANLKSEDDLTPGTRWI